MKTRHHSSGAEFNAETLAIGLGYDPALSQGAVKPPVFLSSTFQFQSAAEGKRFFELAYGLRAAAPGEEPGLIYSRLNNPNLQIFEERIAAWDRTEAALSFASGMAAITTSVLALVRPGEVILSTAPVYGGTHYFFRHLLPGLGIEVHTVAAGTHAHERLEEAARRVGPERVRLLFVETPANPSLRLTDIAAVAALARRLSAGRASRPVLTAVDNTILGPVFQRPAALGADLVLYSATKFIGGHSDLIAGTVSGPRALMGEIATWRTILGTMPNPFTGWLLLRSLEKVSVRMRRQAKSAQKLALLLAEHPRVRRVFFPGLLAADDPQAEVWRRCCSGTGSLISFEIDGGEAEAFAVLDRFEVCRLAVSLGGTETLVEHPMSMTHADVPPEELEEQGVREGMIRLSVGLEHLSDLRRDLLHALGTG